MAGLFGFGKKTKYIDDLSVEVPEEKQEAYFLPPDDAKTLGNIEFMRKPNTIKRSFPKIGESIKQVSSMEKTKGNGMSAAAESKTELNSSASNEKAEKRSGDSNLDPFRQMAKEIKK